MRSAASDSDATSGDTRRNVQEAHTDAHDPLAGALLQRLFQLERSDRLSGESLIWWTFTRRMAPRGETPDITGRYL
jgi:hypothetical protein